MGLDSYLRLNKLIKMNPWIPYFTCSEGFMKVKRDTIRLMRMRKMKSLRVKQMKATGM